MNETQKQAILNKMQELANQKPALIENFRNMTPEQRRAEMEKRKTEMKTWADSLGIDPSILGGFGRHNPAPPFGHRMGGVF